MLYGRTRGQSTLEIVMLLGFVVAALVAMNVYMKRGIQGKLRESTDQIGEQYSAGYTTATYVTKSNYKQTENMAAGGAVTTTIDRNESSRTGSEAVEDFTPGY